MKLLIFFILIVLTFNLHSKCPKGQRSHNLKNEAIQCFSFQCRGKDLNNFRKQYSVKWSNFYKDIDIYNSKTWKNSFKKLKKNSKLNKKQLLILQLLLQSKYIQKINLYDANIIKSWLKNLKINKIDKNQIIKKFFNKKSLFIKKYKTIRSFLKKHNRRAIKWKTDSYLGPFIEFYKGVCGIDKEDKEIGKILRSKTVKCDIKKDFFNNIDNKNFLNYLLKIIERGDLQIVGELPKKITPFIAKIILTETIDQKLYNDKRWNDRENFWNQIIHKSSYSECRCGRFCSPYQGNYNLNPNLTIAHMGYQLIHSIEGANVQKFQGISLLKNGKILNKIDKKVDTAGIECSLFIQRGVEYANIGNIKGRMKTFTMLKKLTCGKEWLAYHGIFNCEKNLKPADIIQLKGHTYLFLGFFQKKDEIEKYGKEIAKYYFTTIEATGGTVRSVGVFFRKHPYETKEDKTSCDINEVWKEPDGMIELKYDEVFRFFRLK